MRLVITAAALLLGLPLVSACVHSAVYSNRAEKAHPPAGDIVSLNETPTHVVRRGTDGPPVLMIHGASANAEEFTHTLAPRLDDRFQVLIADRPGHGYSARPSGGYELETQAAQMAAILETYAGDEPAIIVGHSFGGAVALRLALDYPDRVAGLVLLAPVSHDWGGGGVAWHTRYAASPVLGPVFAQLVPIVGPGVVEDGISGVFHPEPAPDEYYRKAALPLLFRPSHFRSNAKDVANLRGELAAQQARYGELTMPIVVFSGVQDTVIKPELHVGRLRQMLDQVEVVEIAEGGHMPHHAHGAAIADVITRLAMPTHSE
ncbi:MAG: alpha/beta hydrolase [Pseudomonadota bacterium]